MSLQEQRDQLLGQVHDKLSRLEGLTLDEEEQAGFGITVEDFERQSADISARLSGLDESWDALLKQKAGIEQRSGELSLQTTQTAKKREKLIAQRDDLIAEYEDLNKEAQGIQHELAGLSEGAQGAQD